MDSGRRQKQKVIKRKKQTMAKGKNKQWQKVKIDNIKKQKQIVAELLTLKMQVKLCNFFNETTTQFWPKAIIIEIYGTVNQKL